MGASKEWFMQEVYEPPTQYELQQQALEASFEFDCLQAEQEDLYWSSESASIDAACEASEAEAHYYGW